MSKRQAARGSRGPRMSNSQGALRALTQALQALRSQKASKAQPRKAGTSIRGRNLSGRNTAPVLINSAGAECAVHYGSALLDPFNTTEGVCVPKFPAIESAKRVIFAKGVGQCVNYNGGIVAVPMAGNDSAGISFSQPGWVPSAVGALPKGTDTNVGSSSLASDYTEASFATASGDVQCRCVAYGIRVRYTGTELNRGGSVYTLEEPDHASLSGVVVTDLRKYKATTASKFGDDWVTVLYQPRFPADFGYHGNALGQTVNDKFLAISIQAAFASAPFEWEVFAHYEFIGRPVTGKTTTHTEPYMTEKILSAIAQKPHYINSVITRNPSLARKYATGAASQGVSVWKQLAKGGGALIGGFMGGAKGAMLGSSLAGMAF